MTDLTDTAVRLAQTHARGGWDAVAREVDVERAALAEVARQPVTAEMDSHDREAADYQHQYNHWIRLCRAALGIVA